MSNDPDDGAVRRLVRRSVPDEAVYFEENLRQEVSALALSAAEQILSAEIDKAKHQEILSKVSNKLG